MSGVTDIWCTRIVLVALARRMARRRHAFSLADLLTWCPELGQQKTARFTCLTLRKAGLLEAAPGQLPVDNQNPCGPAKWQFTTAGWEAARAAQAEAASHARSRTMTQLNREPKGIPLPQKLWTLLRARRRITSVDAAELLGDAGGDHTAMVKALGRLLACWAAVAPELVQIGARRIQGCHVYVLVAESAPHKMPDSLRNAEEKAAAKKAAEKQSAAVRKDGAP